jgi:hypothetical protein
VFDGVRNEKEADHRRDGFGTCCTSGRERQGLRVTAHILAILASAVLLTAAPERIYGG